ncbi:MAG: hypothetical protein WC538_06370 [Thermoanaerobaculia bacterium]|jgi:hypothetical protein
MQFDRIDERDRLVEFTLSGEIDLQGLMVALRIAQERCVTSGRWGALFDIRGASGTLTAEERMQLITALLPEWNRKVVLAMLLGDEQFLPSRFGQLAAQNRGVRTREFKEREPALAWLATVLADEPHDERLDSL